MLQLRSKVLNDQTDEGVWEVVATFDATEWW
jgi:hypothetical protein